jgi:hypothetical protein
MPPLVPVQIPPTAEVDCHLVEKITPTAIASSSTGTWPADDLPSRHPQRCQRIDARRGRPGSSDER